MDKNLDFDFKLGKTRRRFIKKIFLLSAIGYSFPKAVFSKISAPVSYINAESTSIPTQFKERTVSIVDFGAYGDGVHDDTIAFQNACIFVHNNGGGKIFLPKPLVKYILSYPVFLFDNTELYGTGEDCEIVFLDPYYSKGRGGFVIGSSLEANRDKALSNYKHQDNSSTINRGFSNPQISNYLKDNPHFTQAQNSTIHDVHLSAKFSKNDGWGGYGINFVNAWNCHAYNIWGDGWTQLIGMGSDVYPETPSNYLCSAKNLHVLSPDPVRTYYAIGFIANSTDCTIGPAKLYKPMTAGTKNGSGVATNACQNCIITDIDIPDLGRTQSSEGVLINNSKGCIVNNIIISNAISAISSFYTIAEFNDRKMPNLFGPNIIADNCDAVFSLSAKFSRIKGFTNKGSGVDVYFKNINATNNIIQGKVSYLKFGTGGVAQYLDSNAVTGIKKLRLIIRDDSRASGSYAVNNDLLRNKINKLIKDNIKDAVVIELPTSSIFFDTILIHWMSAARVIDAAYIVRIDSDSNVILSTLVSSEINSTDLPIKYSALKTVGNDQLEINVFPASHNVLFIFFTDKLGFESIDNISVDYYSSV